MKAALAIPLILAYSLAAAGSSDMSPVAKTYLDQALDLIEKNSIKQKTDWIQLRKIAYEKAADAKTITDTYPAIREALTFLGDHHSQLFDQEQVKLLSKGRLKNSGMECIGDVIVRVMPASPAAAAGVRSGMRIITLNGQPYDAEKTPIRRIKEPFTIEAQEGTRPARTFSITPAEHLAVRPPSGRLIDGHYGYLDVPSFEGGETEEHAYAQTLQDLIHKFDTKGLRGWIIDLRLNGGGNMWPMIAGVGPLYPAGKLGDFVDAAGNHEPWSYKDGTSYDDTMALATTPHPYVLKHQGLPIVVLTDQLTASSGEAVVVAFRGLSNATSLGQATYGVPTGNMMHKLSDGAVLNLCEVIDADRTGKTYDTKIPPDILVETNWTRFNQRDDHAILAAIRWINGRK